MLGYVLRFTQGTERAFYCTQQSGGRYLAMFRREEEITGAIAFLQEGQVRSTMPGVTMEAMGVPTREALLAIAHVCVPPVDGLAIALDFRANGSVARWGFSDWDTLEVRC